MGGHTRTGQETEEKGKVGAISGHPAANKSPQRAARPVRRSGETFWTEKGGVMFSE